jgi:CubicO group peptidase (beta-lactamase class C family)
MNTWFSGVESLMRQGVADGVFPGAVLLVSRAGRILFQQACGVRSHESSSRTTIATVFDLASLTKPLATTLAVMRLVEDGELRLDEPLAAALPAFVETDKHALTIEHLLSHTSGLPDYRPWYRELAAVASWERRPRLQALLRAEPLAYPPGERALYSDLDFMLLGWVVEAVSGRRLDRFLDDAVYAPLGLTSVFFVDLQQPRPVGAFAATERCDWRGRVVEAEVHDEHAHALGGIAGHAGLFGTAAGVHALIRELLKAYHSSAGGRVFRRETVQRFVRRVPGTDKALGFDMPAEVRPSCGSGFPPTAIGHLGFTGTSFWVRLEDSTAVVLLTNRVHPTRANIAIRRFRPILHEAVMAAVGRLPPRQTA